MHKLADRLRDVVTSDGRLKRLLPRREHRIAEVLIRVAESERATTMQLPSHFHEARLPTARSSVTRRASTKAGSFRSDCESVQRGAPPEASRRRVQKSCPSHQQLLLEVSWSRGWIVVPQPDRVEQSDLCWREHWILQAAAVLGG